MALIHCPSAKTYRITYTEAGPFKVESPEKGPWTGRDTDFKLRYSGEGFIVCEENCSYVLYAKNATRKNGLPAHCHEIETRAVVEKNPKSCFYL